MTMEPTQDQIDQVLEHLRRNQPCEHTVLSYHANTIVRCTLPSRHDGNHMGAEINGEIRWWDL
jgi:hypothetical protein